jgi:hypothetical protein
MKTFKRYLSYYLITLLLLAGLALAGLGADIPESGTLLAGGPDPVANGYAWGG